MNKITIEKASKGDLIKSILIKEPQLNFNIIKTILRKRDVKVNGKRIAETITLKGGEKIEIFLPTAKEKEVEVVFEDDNILIANKPRGMEVTIKDKVFDKSKCLEEYFKPYRAVHRLDKNTEGLVIMAKNSNAENALIAGFKKEQVKKHYMALVAGKPKPESANLVDYLIKEEKGVKVFKNNVENSVKIMTNYKTVSTNGETTLLEVELITGKTHQIRAHLAFHNIYILGDEKYGNKTVNKKFKTYNQKLCAYKLNFDLDKTNPLNYLNQKTFTTSPSFSLLSII
jgi:23S rRNA pseudouridine955/2504/2580 synthase